MTYAWKPASDTFGRMVAGRFVAVPAGVAYQLRCRRNVELRACRATYRVVGYVGG